MIHYPLDTGSLQFFQNTPTFREGMLMTSGMHSVYWEACGNPSGKPVLIVHGGPGSGATPYWRQFFDPALYHIILFDQRGCGRSTPHAGDTVEALVDNTTAHLIEDMEQLRALFHIDKWMLLAARGGLLSLCLMRSLIPNVSQKLFFGRL